MGKFTIFKGRDGQFYFNLKAGNGEIILQSQGYTTKSSCIRGIQSVKVNSKLNSRYLRKSNSSTQFYFILIASNSQTIGKSQMYKTRYAMEIGVQSVIQNAFLAPIIELKAEYSNFKVLM